MEATELLTPAGAALFAVLATKAATILSLPGQYARAFCLLSGITAHGLALLAWSDQPFTLQLALAIIPAGLVAGMAGVQGFDSARSGPDYVAVAEPDFEALKQAAEGIGT